MGFPWPAALAAVASIGSTALGARARRRTAKASREGNLELAKFQYSKDLEMWRRMNRYNSPEQQMKRFKEAGLNPHLIYSQGSPGQATQMPQFQAPRLEYDYTPMVDPSSVIQNYQNFSQQKSQIDLTKRNIEVQKVIQDLNATRESGVFQENVIRSLEATIAQKIMQDHLVDLNDIASMRIGSMAADEWYKQALSDIKRWEKGLTDNNINPRDSTTIRMVIDLLDMLGFSPEHLKRKYGINN